MEQIKTWTRVTRGIECIAATEADLTDGMWQPRAHIQTNRQISGSASISTKWS